MPSELLVPDFGGKGNSDMKNDRKYTTAPPDIEESLKQATVVPNFELSPDSVKAFAAKRAKKAVSIYLSVDTIEKFKRAADKNGGRYQTMISDVLDVYTQQYLDT
jgi:predicted DNA binding CopG/RHH family protein